VLTDDLAGPLNAVGPDRAPVGVNLWPAVRGEQA
jgi:hypothetical protein